MRTQDDSEKESKYDDNDDDDDDDGDDDNNDNHSYELTRSYCQYVQGWFMIQFLTGGINLQTSSMYILSPTKHSRRLTCCYSPDSLDVYGIALYGRLLLVGLPKNISFFDFFSFCQVYWQ